MTRNISRFQPSLFDELIVDNFAGGGGASTGIELALGRSVDIAINHSPEAVAMHKINHPYTTHYCEDVWDVDPLTVCKGRNVGLAWFSPDCKHFSKAKGGKPVSRKIRGLAWVVVRWAKKVKPRIIMLENVEEFKDWGPLAAVCDKHGNPKKDKNGEKILKPCGVNKGATFYKWVHQLEKLGYEVDWRELKACDYGAPTSRKRLFLVARCDGLPIVWPEQTHGDRDDLHPYRTAAEIIDWSIPAPSIFERKRPLAENTMKRIAKGLQKFVFESADPFFISYYGPKSDGEFRGFGLGNQMPTQTTENRFGLVTPFVTECANSSCKRNMPLNSHLRTITAWPKGGSFAIVTPHIQRQFGNSVGHDANEPLGTITAGGSGKSAIIAPTLIQSGYGERKGQSPRVPGLDKPLGTVVGCGVKHALINAFLAKHYGGNYDSGGIDIRNPASTITTKDHHSLVSSHLIKLRGTCKHGQGVKQPLPTVTAGGTHIGEVRAFMLKYYGTNTGHDCKEPLQTITTKDRFGIVTIKGTDYQIVDIGMRMLTPRELFRGQGFTDEYVIDPIFNGKPLTKTKQVEMVGNSVSPFPAMALVRANVEISSAISAVA